MTVDWRTPDRQPQACGAPTHAPWGVEVHHTPQLTAHNRDELVDVCRRIYDYHVHTKGWADGWYQYVIALDGSLAEMRGFDCASYADDGGPDDQVDRLTVALTGNYDTEAVTHAQRVTLGRLADQVVRDGGGRDQTYHAARASTSCPGANVIAAFNSASLFPAPSREEDDMAYLFRVGDDSAVWVTNDLFVRVVDRQELDRLRAKFGDPITVSADEVEHIPLVGPDYDKGFFKTRLTG